MRGARRAALPNQSSALRKSRTRAAGSPVARRSEMTAIDCAPASRTDRARFSVMPPMATSGDPAL